MNPYLFKKLIIELQNEKKLKIIENNFIYNPYINLKSIKSCSYILFQKLDNFVLEI
jgi:hypothetical protein